MVKKILDEDEYDADQDLGIGNNTPDARLSLVREEANEEQTTPAIKEQI